MDRWLFGEDNTGDLTKIHNISDIINQVKQDFKDEIFLVSKLSHLEFFINQIISCLICTSISYVEH